MYIKYINANLDVHFYILSEFSRRNLHYIIIFLHYLYQLLHAPRPSRVTSQFLLPGLVQYLVGLDLAPGEMFENMLELKRVGLYLEKNLNRKWLLSYRNRDISYREARGFGGMFPQNILK